MTHHVDPVVLADALADLRNEPPPADSMAGGCSLAIVLLVFLILVMPVISRVSALPNGVVFGVSAVLAGIGLVAALLGVFTGRDPARLTANECEKAIERLRSEYAGAGDSARMAGAAVRLLEFAVVERVDGAPLAIDGGEVRERLGDAYPYLISAERTLLDLGLIEPVFTDGLRPRGSH